jgi:thioredoxin 1
MANQFVCEFTDQNFDAEVLSAREPVLVDFWAEWCPPCLLLGPIIDKIAAQYAGHAKVGKLDVDANKKIVERYAISAVPTVLIFRNGEVTQKFVGLKSEADFTRALDGVPEKPAGDTSPVHG